MSAPDPVRASFDEALATLQAFLDSADGLPSVRRFARPPTKAQDGEEEVKDTQTARSCPANLPSQDHARAHRTADLANSADERLFSG